MHAEEQIAVAFLTRKLYGRSTEQTSTLGIKGQMSLFDEAKTSTDTSAAEPLSKISHLTALQKASSGMTE